MAQLVDQPTSAPTRKVVFATIGSMAGSIIGGLLARFVGAPFDEPAVLGGWPVIGAFVAGWFARERASNVRP